MILWSHAGPSIVSAFLASLVEFVEALTIVLAVGTVRGWRSALTGAAAGGGLLAVLVVAFGPMLQLIPIHLMQLVVGGLLVLFGMRWLRKAILRSAGVIALHDEAKEFAEETARLGTGLRGAIQGLDALAVATTFKAVVLEGVEVVFIVLAVGAVGGMLVPAALGAGAALALVVALGLAVHKPLAQVPENTLKFIVGVMLSAYGIFWLGEGLGLTWPGEDMAIVALAALLLGLSLATSRFAQQIARART